MPTSNHSVENGSLQTSSRPSARYRLLTSLISSSPRELGLVDRATSTTLLS